MNLIGAIKKAQESRNLSDTKFAGLLGVDLSTWSRIKRELRPPGRKFLTAVMVNLPELSIDVMYFMKTATINQGTENEKK